MLSHRVLLVIAVGLTVSNSAPSESQHESAGLQGREKSKGVDSEDSFNVRSVPRQQNWESEGIKDWLEIQDTENTNFRSKQDGALNNEGTYESWELGYPEKVDEKMVETNDVFGMSTNAEEQGASSKVTDCVTAIANTGLKRAFPRCKDYISNALQFCKSPTSKHVQVCKTMFTSISLATNECDVETQQGNPVSEICKTLSQPKRSKASCKPGQLFGQIPGSSSTPVCFDAPRGTQSKTRQLPLYYLYPKQSLNSVEMQKLTIEQSAVINTYSPENTDTVEIHTLPIGQGDCTVIYCPNEKHAILFDCGAKGGNMLSPPQIRDFFSSVDSISILISHGHADHYNNIPAVFDVKGSPDLVGKIREVIVGGPPSDYSCKRIQVWLKMISQGKTVKFLTDSSQVHQLPLCKETKIEFHVVVGNSQTPRAKNERGMVMKLHCPLCQGSDETPPRSASLLFAGDMEGPTAKKLAETFSSFLDSTHYKMSHHGASLLANHEDWLNAIKPVEVHISHKYENRYNHPRCEAIDRLMKLSPKTVGTTAGAIGGEEHLFTCVKTDGQHNDQKIFDRLYSTAPRVNMICYIRLLFKLHGEATTDYYCGATPEDIYPDLDDCEEEDD